MNLLPHIVALHEIRSRLEALKKDRNTLLYILDSYAFIPTINAIYGHQFIDSAIKYIEETDFNYCLGYRLDTTRLPNISVMFEGGNENTMALGDIGYLSEIPAAPKKYFNFQAKEINGEFLKVRKDDTISFWKGMKLFNTITKQSYEIKEVLILEDVELILDRTVESSELMQWQAMRNVNYETWTIGSSLDNVNVKIYLDVPGDPEYCEIVSCLIRYILKSSRLALLHNGLNNPTISYSAIGKNSDYDGQNVWTMEFTIRAEITDEWILKKEAIVDKMELEQITCKIERNV